MLFFFFTFIHILFVLDSGSFLNAHSAFLAFKPDLEGSDLIMFLCAPLISFHHLVEPLSEHMAVT